MRETLSLVATQELRLRVFENKALRMEPGLGGGNVWRRQNMEQKEPSQF
jgi:hypothetical protein